MGDVTTVTVIGPNLYVEVAAEVYSRWQASHGDRGARLLALLKFLTHEGSRSAWAGLRYMADFVGCSVRTVQRLIADLLQAGLVWRARRFKRCSVTRLHAAATAVARTFGATDRRGAVMSRIEEDDPRRETDRLARVWSATMRQLNSYLKGRGQRTLRIRFDPHAARGWIDVGGLDDYETDDELAREVVRVVTQWQTWSDGKGSTWRPSCAHVLDQMGNDWSEEKRVQAGPQYPQLADVFREIYGEEDEQKILKMGGDR